MLRNGIVAKPVMLLHGSEEGPDVSGLFVGIEHLVAEVAAMPMAEIRRVSQSPGEASLPPSGKKSPKVHADCYYGRQC